jgi:hypothetical protein
MNVKRMLNELIDALDWREDDDLVQECVEHLDCMLKFSKEEVEEDDE